MGFSRTLSPRIAILEMLTTLKLPGNGISGKIPEEFGNLTSLTMLDLENNHLTGEIPSSLGNIKGLKFLILSDNNLSGSIPKSLSSLSNLFTKNWLDCDVISSPPCASENAGDPRKSRTGLILAIVAPLFTVFLLGFSVLLFTWKGWTIGYGCEVFVDVAGDVDQKIEFGQLKRFSWRELQVATDGFSEKNVLGQGGSGKCEVEMISVAVHRNLLRLIGFCTTPTERLLVYPFMQNLSVASRLREPGHPVLDWITRESVALGTERALEYLHEHCNPKIIHRDVKAANVLLDSNLQAVVGDFGLAKLVDVRKTNITTQVRGTMGHIAPEYLSTGKSSEKTNVFGYGIMLLELVTGQRAIDFSRIEEEDDVLLLDHVKKLQQESKLEDIVDCNLARNYDIEQVEIMVQIALLCTQSTPEQRPAMSEVVRMLEGEGLAERWEVWRNFEKMRRLENERQIQLGRAFNQPPGGY
ncbi:hypothetical protein SASPL_154632 [Salvia splendens]|uniref:non-specific serine/threonine protein kinase n=1 Tax=Salvia splendens TaxID=180675 RepID=A0A8X8YYV5_SALSN|nr:hypothetical protein SASPL_154632 [Salvia splendens]